MKKPEIFVSDIHFSMSYFFVNAGNLLVIKQRNLIVPSYKSESSSFLPAFDLKQLYKTGRSFDWQLKAVLPPVICSFAQLK